MYMYKIVLNLASKQAMFNAFVCTAYLVQNECIYFTKSCILADSPNVCAAKWENGHVSATQNTPFCIHNIVCVYKQFVI